MTIVLTPAASAIVKADVSAFKRDGKRYSDYVAEMSVTAENLPEHVAAFRDAFKAASPKATGDQIKAYATKVRNGLKYNLPKVDRETVERDYLAALIKATETAMSNGIERDAILDALANLLG